MDSTATLAAAKTDVFGKDPVLGTDGQPLERGVGSPWARADHIKKARFHAAYAWAGTDDLVSSAKALLATAEKIAAASKASIEAAAKADEELLPKAPDVKNDPAYLDLKDQFDRAVAERDVLTKLPAATAHNVARDAAEQKLLDDYRAEQERAAKQKIEDARLAKEKADKAAADALKPVVPTPAILPPLVPSPGVKPDQAALDKAAADAAARAAAFDKTPVTGTPSPVPIAPAQDAKLTFLGG